MPPSPVRDDDPSHGAPAATADQPSGRAPTFSFLASPGQLGQLIAAHDWSATPLGPIDIWPQSLRTTLSLMLNTTHPMWLGWGEGMTFLYNDAYIDVLSQAKHPWALGRPAQQVWAEIWDICGPLADKVFHQAEATFVDDTQLFMDRGDRLEEKWFSFSYSPIADESGTVGGLFCPSTDATASNLNRRRLATLSRLSALALRENTVSTACMTALEVLAANSADIPFSLLYLLDEKTGAARLQETVHLGRDAALALDQAAADRGQGSPWGLRDMAAGSAPVLVDTRALPGLPLGLADQPVQQALALALKMPGRELPVGVLVLGVSPVRLLDAEYRTFFELVAGQVEAAIQNAMAAEEQRRRAQALEELDRAKTAFFSNVSHEFRTPLTLMLGPLEDALAEGPLPPAQQERLELVRRNALRLQKLVNTLLDFSRVQAGASQAAFAEVDLPAITTDLASGFRSIVEGAGLSLDVRCEPLGEAVYVDLGMWEKIVLNLLSNAFKFTLQGGIRLSLVRQGEQAVLAVEDSGVGIAPEDLGRIFGRFQRVMGSASRTHEGSGIGLALVSDLVHLLHGSISVSSEVGRGSRFTVALPLGRAHVRDDQLRAPGSPSMNTRTLETYTSEAQRWLPGAADRASAPAPAGSVQGGTDAVDSLPRVLLADDNADMRAYLERLVGQRWQVAVAGNGQQALEMARAQPPDLIVSDVMMPLLDGFGLISALRADTGLRDVPVVLLSARAGEESRIEGLNAGADDYLVKPFSAKELLTRIDSQLLKARLRKAERGHAQRMAAILAQAPAAIAILRGPQHVYELVNPTYTAMIGGRDVLGLPIRQALPELEGGPVFGLLDQVYASGQPYIGQSLRADLARGPDGVLEECFFDFVYQPLRGAGGAVEGITVVAYEVTALARARRDAEVANRAKDEFLAMLGHELRNPLSPILIALELMRLKGKGGMDKEHAIIERQARHLVRLVDDLLDVARIASGKVELRLARQDMAPLIAQAVETASPLLEEKQHRLKLELPEGPVFIQADAERFAQILSNLLTNAAKYTQAGGNIVLRLRADAGEAVVEVEDNGMGISPAMLEQLFDKFVQERQALDRSRGGLGLGLSIVKSLVGLHGGSVTAHSQGEGRGAMFRVRVPLADVDHVTSGPRPELAQPPAAASAAAQAQAAVLLVDDNPDVLEVLRTVLELDGHQVTAVSDPATALKLPAEFAPRVAVLDIGLPGMDGYDLARALAQRPGFANTRLVALSGYGTEADRQRAKDAGFARHLVKPVGADQLSAIVAEMLASA